jgi:hypothetical protein
MKPIIQTCLDKREKGEREKGEVLHRIFQEIYILAWLLPEKTNQEPFEQKKEIKERRQYFPSWHQTSKRKHSLFTKQRHNVI